MTAAERHAPARSWEGAGVDVGAIDAALTALWLEHGVGSAAAGGLPTARSSVMNLIVVASDKGVLAESIAAIGDLTELHPSRTVGVLLDPAAVQPALDATATNVCMDAADRAGRLCWEQVGLTAHGALAEHVAGVVTQLLLPDLPTYLWWRDEIPFGEARFERMAAMSDHLIVDCALAQRPIDTLMGLAARNGEDDRSYATGAVSSAAVSIGDMAWQRLTPWRNLAAQFFDGSEHTPFAHAIDRVSCRVANARGPLNPAGALLLAGWLAACLDWTPQPHESRLDEHSAHLQASADRGVVTIEIEAIRDSHATEGDLVALTLGATLRGAAAEFSISHDPAASQATTAATIGGTPGAARTVSLPASSLTAHLSRELGMAGRDRLFEDALRLAAAFCKDLAVQEQP